MGSGYRDFTAGAVLTSDQVDGYLMRQAVMTFADATARDTALSGVLDEGMVCFLEDAPNRLVYYDGSGWQIALSEYQSWSPSYNSVTVGDGTVFARYAYIGPKTIHAVWQLALGASSVIGSNPRVSLPVATDNTTSVHSGIVHFFDDSTSTNYSGRIVAFTGSSMELTVLDSSGTYVTAAALSSTVPFTWATGDVMAFAVTYSIA